MKSFKIKIRYYVENYKISRMMSADPEININSEGNHRGKTQIRVMALPDISLCYRVVMINRAWL